MGWLQAASLQDFRGKTCVQGGLGGTQTTTSNPIIKVNMNVQHNPVTVTTHDALRCLFVLFYALILDYKVTRGVQQEDVWITSSTGMVADRTRSRPIDLRALWIQFIWGHRFWTKPWNTICPHSSTPHLKHTIVFWMTLWSVLLHLLILLLILLVVLQEKQSWGFISLQPFTLPPEEHTGFHSAEFNFYQTQRPSSLIPDIPISWG